MSNNPSEYIFISYARKDSDVLQVLQHFLSDHGIRCWTDESIEVGTPNWRRALDKAIREAISLIVLLSPDAANSQWVLEEIALAELVKRPIIPLLIKGEPADAIPLGLILAQYIDMRFDWDAGCQKLLNFLEKNAPAHSIPMQTTTKINSKQITIVFPDNSLLFFKQEPAIDKIWSIVKNHLTESQWHEPIVQAIRTTKHTDVILGKLLKADRNPKLRHYPLLIAVSTLAGNQEVAVNLRQKIITTAFNRVYKLPWGGFVLYDPTNKPREVTGKDIWYLLARIPRDDFLNNKYYDVLQDQKARPELRISTATILENFTALEGFALGEWGHGISHNFSAVTALFLKGEINRLKQIVSSPGIDDELGLKTTKYLILANEGEFVKSYLFGVLDRLTITDYTEKILIIELFKGLGSREGLLKIATSNQFNHSDQQYAMDALVKLGYIEDVAKLYFDWAISSDRSLYNPYIKRLGELGQVGFLETIVKSAKGNQPSTIDGADTSNIIENLEHQMTDIFSSIFDSNINAALLSVSELSRIGAIDKLEELSHDEGIHWMVKHRILLKLQESKNELRDSDGDAIFDSHLDT